MLVATPGAGLARVAGVDALHADAPFFRLVDEKGPKDSERPAVQPALAPVGLAPFDASANVRQVLHRQGAARRHALDDALAHHMIVVTTAARGFARQFLEVALGTLGALLLERQPQ